MGKTFDTSQLAFLWGFDPLDFDATGGFFSQIT